MLIDYAVAALQIMNFIRHTALAAAVLSLSPAPSTAAEPPDSDLKRIAASRIESAPIIDGRLDEPIWQSATVIEDIHQVAPHEYEAPGERTIFYVMYDKDALYV